MEFLFFRNINKIEVKQQRILLIAHEPGAENQANTDFVVQKI